MAYDDASHSVYWTDVRQRTINRVALSNHSRHPVINTVYLAPGLYVRLSVCLSVCLSQRNDYIYSAAGGLWPGGGGLWPGGGVRSRVRLPADPLPRINLGQVVYTHALLSPSSRVGSGQGAVMPCVWEGNRRSGIALAMRHRLKWFIYLRAHGLDREMSTPPTLSCGVWPIYLTPDRAAEYCDERVYLSVCIFVCPRSYLRNYVTRPIFTEIFVIFVQCYLWPWLGPPLAAL